MSAARPYLRLPNHDLDGGEVDLRPKTCSDFGRIGGFEEQLDGLDQFCPAFSMLSPWLATSSSGQSETHPSPSRSITITCGPL